MAMGSRAANFMEEDREVKKNSILAYGQSVEVILEPDKTLVGNIKCNIGNNEERKLPEHLWELLDRSSAELNVTQQIQLEELLTEFEDIFSDGKTNIGRTDVVKHYIDTQDASPIKLVPRRIPIHLRPEADKIVQDMIDQDIIEPSSSPWGAPTVLVKKIGRNTEILH